MFRIQPKDDRPQTWGLARVSPLLLAALVASLLAAAPFAWAGGTAADGEREADGRGQTIQVYKTPTCGCCTKWIDHLRAAGFAVEATDLPDLTSLKAMNGVPAGLSSCHTATIEGYVIEGHVPASDIVKLLKERPKVAGLAVPGMPMGSPGMEHPDPDRHEAFDVVAFGATEAPTGAGVSIFSSHTP
jgi:hypothetical protein